jgi:hypothetical protein
VLFPILLRDLNFRVFSGAPRLSGAEPVPRGTLKKALNLRRARQMGNIPKFELFGMLVVATPVSSSKR